MNGDKRLLYRFLVVCALFGVFTPLIAAARYQAAVTIPLAHLTPEEARNEARRLAYAEMIAEGAGIAVNSQMLVVNNSAASYSLVQSRNARVLNGKCDFEVTDEEGAPFLKASCSGEVQPFGQDGPKIAAALTPFTASREHCTPTLEQLRSAERDASLFRSGERFCLALRSAEAVSLGVFAIFTDSEGVPRINRLLPSANSKRNALRLAAGEIPSLTPVASAPLPGAKVGHEALLVVASRQPLLLDQLVTATVGSSAAETAAMSVPLAEFDRQLGRLDLQQLTLLTLPYVVHR
ncbi:MAG: hypothetical protein HQL48_08680 [Gammaproteobacteria bacterium]|nr:hypothetical protein [Gammaproteobacteria bacterium]